MPTKKPIHTNHRQRLRERYERDGAVSFESHELLELFLFSALPRVNTNPLAHELLNRFGSLYGVFTAKYDELISVAGIGDKTARYIIDSYGDYCRECEADMRSHPCKSFECASNLLLWHMRHSNAKNVLLFLDDEFNVIEITDTGSQVIYEDLFVGKSIGATRVIIGTKDRPLPHVIDKIKSADIILSDIIIVDDFNTESVLSEYIS